VPRKPTLSPSKITTYLACPVKYKWTYVDDRGKWYLKSKSYFSFGTSLHRVLQRFHDTGDQGVTSTNEAVAALEESWIDAGYASQEEMNQALAEGKEIIETYVDQVEKAPVTAQTVMVEKMLRHDLGPFVLIGRLDRVDQYDDGTLEVIDYKSGRAGVTDEEVEADLAMGVYQILVGSKHPDQAVKATIIALRSGEKGTASLSAAQIEELRSDLVAIGQEILDRDYEGLEPKPKALCHSCDFLPLCSKSPDFELS
jgi:RecB family exonuclease